ncbi:hypothetical protein KQH82_10855 [bacterium]|nr:hypothetical protein [bacterium]
MSHSSNGFKTVLLGCVLLIAAVSSATAVPPYIGNLPVMITGDVCDAFYFDFDYLDPEGDTAFFVMDSGPGEIDRVTGIWTYSPTLDDVGISQTLVLHAETEFFIAGPSVEIEIVVTNDPPVITNCPLDNISTFQGYPRYIQLQASGACPADGSVWRIVANDAPSTYSIDSLTGLLTARAQPYFGAFVVVELSDADLALECHVTFDVASTSCAGGQTGDFNRDSIVDLSDLIILVNFMFNQSGDIPIVLANINGDQECTVDLTDLIHFVNYLFLGGPPPADCILECEWAEW